MNNKNLVKNAEYFQSKINGNFRENFIKKDVKWHDKNKGYKKIMINKSDNVNVDVGDEVYIITPNQLEHLNKLINEYEIKISELERDIKRSDETINKKVNDAVHETTNKYQLDIDALNKEINQLKKDNVNLIADINRQHHQEIKEYQEAKDKLLNDKAELNEKHHQKIKELTKQHNQEIKELNEDIKEYQEANNKLLNDKEDLTEQHNQEIKKLNKQLKEYESKEFNYAIKYNNLRQAIINIGWFDAVRNKHKAIAKEYPPLEIGADSTTIDINTKD